MPNPIYGAWHLTVIATLGGLCVSCRLLGGFANTPADGDIGKNGAGEERGHCGINVHAVHPSSDESAQKLLEYMQRRDHELCEWVVPLLDSYLPEKRKVLFDITLDLGLPSPYVFGGEHSLSLDLASHDWRGNGEVLWTSMIRLIYRSSLKSAISDGLIADLDENPRKQFVDYLLQRIEIDGMALYVSAQGTSLTLAAPAYQDLRSSLAVTSQFSVLQDATRGINDASAKELARRWEDLSKPESFVFAVCGAHMAKAIEGALGHTAFLGVVAQGPWAFYENYQGLMPGAQFDFKVPKEPQEKETPPDAVDVLQAH